MKCPHCEQEIPGVACPVCDQTSPEGARHCMHCGGYLDEDEEEFTESEQVETDTQEEVPPDTEDARVEDERDEDLEEEDFDFENRVLCPDGACTGIIENGKCVVCGKKVKDASSKDASFSDKGSKSK